MLKVISSLGNYYKKLALDYPYFFAYFLYEKFRFGWASPLPTTKRSDVANLFLHGGSLAQRVNDTDLSSDAFCCNEFCKTSYFAIIKPTYYVILDPVYYDLSMVKDSPPPKMDTLKDLNELTQWKLNLFLPLEARASKLTSLIDNPLITVRYFSKAPLPDASRFSKWLFYHTSMMPPLFNVSVALISIAAKIGFKIINVYGMDLSYYKYFSVDKNNIPYVGNSHFYEDNDEKAVFMVASKALGGYVQGTASLFFQRMYQSIAAHEQLAKISSSHSQIINFSPYSVVDAYDKIQQ